MKTFKFIQLASYFKVFFFVFVFLAFYSKAQAASTITIVDLKGSKVVLTKLESSSITLKSGDSKHVISLKSIKGIAMKDDGNTLSPSGEPV